jgi:hypothetical protein
VITFTQLYTEAADGCGILLTDTVNVNYIKRNINNALKLFKNDARRYFTRKEVVADLQPNQQYYTLPADSIRGNAIRINNGSLIFPITGVESEQAWNAVNVIPNFAVFYPQRYFFRGATEVGVWPIPSTLLTGGLIISYDGRLTDMYLDDTVGVGITATQGSQSITCTSGSFNSNMVGMKFSVTDGSDGNWYNILSYTNGDTLLLDNYYQGPTVTTTSTIIGSCPDIPEEYQMGLEFYALHIFHLLKRGNVQKADYFKEQYDIYHDGYVGAYSSKETSQVVKPNDSIMPYNPLLVPPMNLTG